MLKETSSPYGGVRFTQASRLFENEIASQDSELVRRYKRAGLVIIGRTNAPEFGCNATTEPQLFGPATNPWDTTYSTGGSSGGAASVVAARLIPMANGSDGAGSLRIPASCCGVFSMKPSRGRTPAAHHGGEPLEGMYATLQATNTMVWEVHTAAMRDAIESRLGMKITEEHVEPWTLSLAERGKSFTAASFILRREVNQIATQTLGRFFSRYDMLLTPTLGTPPAKLGYLDTVGLPYEELSRRISDFIPYTWLHNVTGCPAMSVPLYWNAQGLPIGVQIAAAYGDEAILFRLAGQLERARPWHSQVPPVAA